MLWTIEIQQVIEYQKQVLNYLEYLGYPEYVVTFNPNDVALSMARTCLAFYKMGNSVRMCAIVIFSLTLTMQLMNYDKTSIN